MAALGAAGDPEGALDVFDALLAGADPADALRPPAAAAAAAAAPPPPRARPAQQGGGEVSGSSGGSGGDAAAFVSSVLAPEWRGVVPPARPGGGVPLPPGLAAQAAAAAAAKGAPGAAQAAAAAVAAKATSDGSGGAAPPLSQPRPLRRAGRASPGPWRELLDPARAGGSGKSGSSSSSSGSARSGRPAPAPLPRLAGPDAAAWSALVDVLVGAGRLADAEAALEGAVAAAAAARGPPPAEAFGALIKGLRRAPRRGSTSGNGAGGSGGGSGAGGAAERVAAAQRALRRFLALGGRPGRHMCDDVIALCLAAGDVRAARRVLRLMRLTGALADDATAAGYAAWLQRREAQLAAARRGPRGGGGAADGQGDGGPGGGGAQRGGLNQGLERLKWFLGLRNSYYAQD
jgi:hypothetical protein